MATTTIELKIPLGFEYFGNDMRERVLFELDEEDLRDLWRLPKTDNGSYIFGGLNIFGDTLRINL